MLHTALLLTALLLGADGDLELNAPENMPLAAPQNMPKSAPAPVIRDPDPVADSDADRVSPAGDPEKRQKSVVDDSPERHFRGDEKPQAEPSMKNRRPSATTDDYLNALQRQSGAEPRAPTKSKYPYSLPDAARKSEPTESAEKQPPKIPLVMTKRGSFNIPFRSEVPDTRFVPVQALLYVSTDRGAHWNFYTKATPNQGQIPFRTNVDGEYWFAVQVVNRSGEKYPDKIPGPGLRVVVDSTPPAIKLIARAEKDGRIDVSWEIAEPHLRSQTVKLSYRTSPTNGWRPVSMNEALASGSIQSKEVTWLPQSGVREAQIRLDVTDAAGNPGVAYAQVAFRPEEMPFPGSTSDKTNARRDVAEVVSPSPAALARSVAKRVNDSDDGPAVGQVNPQVGDRYGATADSKNASGYVDPAFSALPPGEKPKMVNSRLFELDYEVNAVGPSGISRVELWGTRDGGQSWRLFTIDDDNRSPILVSVDAEGLYGFRVVAVSGAGFGDKAPIRGDLPSVWIGVDVTKPLAKFGKIDLGPEEQDNRLTIRWEASDLHLAERPISLSFAKQPAGPWTSIVSGLKNTGEYAWKYDNHSPALVYLRLEVRDEAGNVTTIDRPEPVALDQAKPSASFINVRAVDKQPVRQWTPAQQPGR